MLFLFVGRKQILLRAPGKFFRRPMSWHPSAQEAANCSLREASRCKSFYAYD